MKSTPQKKKKKKKKESGRDREKWKIIEQMKK